MAVSSGDLFRLKPTRALQDVRAGVWLGRHLSPERIFILSFAGVIVAGALLLSFRSPLPNTRFHGLMPYFNPHRPCA